MIELSHTASQQRGEGEPGLSGSRARGVPAPSLRSLPSSVVTGRRRRQHHGGCKQLDHVHCSVPSNLYSRLFADSHLRIRLLTKTYHNTAGARSAMTGHVHTRRAEGGGCGCCVLPAEAGRARRPSASLFGSSCKHESSRTLFSAMLFTFVCFWLLIFLLKMSPSVMLKCWLVLPSAGRL